MQMGLFGPIRDNQEIPSKIGTPYSLQCIKWKKPDEIMFVEYSNDELACLFVCIFYLSLL